MVGDGDAGPESPPLPQAAAAPAAASAKNSLREMTAGAGPSADRRWRGMAFPLRVPGVTACGKYSRALGRTQTTRSREIRTSRAIQGTHRSPPELTRVERARDGTRPSRRFVAVVVEQRLTSASRDLQVVAIRESLELTLVNAGYCYSSGNNNVGLTVYGYNFDNGTTPHVTLADFECTLQAGSPAEVDTYNGKMVWVMQASCPIPIAFFPKSPVQTGIVRVTSGPKAFQANSMAVSLQQYPACY